MIDWKKVARQRQKTIRAYRITREILASEVEQIIYRHALPVLHARCVGNSDGLAREIAVGIAEKIAEGPE